MFQKGLYQTEMITQVVRLPGAAVCRGFIHNYLLPSITVCLQCPVNVKWGRELMPYFKSPHKPRWCWLVFLANEETEARGNVQSLEHTVIQKIFQVKLGNLVRSSLKQTSTQTKEKTNQNNKNNNKIRCAFHSYTTYLAYSLESCFH